MTRTLSQTLAQLALALVNATLILVIVALILGLRLAGTVERVTEGASAAAAEQLAQLVPIGDEIGALRAEIGGLRSELAEIRAPGDRLGAAAEATAERLQALEAELTTISGALRGAVQRVGEDPGLLIDRAVRSGVSEAGLWVATLRDCRLPPEGVSAQD